MTFILRKTLTDTKIPYTLAGFTRKKIQKSRKCTGEKVMDLIGAYQSSFSTKY